jgi:hypothetical protein
MVRSFTEEQMTRLFYLAGYRPCICTDVKVCPGCSAWMQVVQVFPYYRLPTLLWEDD